MQKFRNKIVISALAAAFLVVGFVPATANALPPLTDVTGVVTDEKGDPVTGAEATVKCGTKTMMDTTDAHGSYLVSFDKADCDFGTTVKVSAKKDGKSGWETGTVSGITTKLNLAIVNVQIPEYGLISGILAGGAGIGAIIYFRRRQMQQGMNA